MNTESNFYTSAEWYSGFTGKLDVTNKSEHFDGWTLEFEAPFEITEIWDAKIISKEGNKYVLGNLDYNKDLASGETETITFNADKVDGEIVAPEHYSLSSSNGAVESPALETITTHNNVDSSAASFYISAEWYDGFTGKLDITNKSENLDGGWKLEFEAPFEITDIWDAKIINKEGNKYVLGNLDYNKDLASGQTETITFNANKIEGEVVAPENYSLSGNGVANEPVAIKNISEPEFSGDAGNYTPEGATGKPIALENTTVDNNENFRVEDGENTFDDDSADTSSSEIAKQEDYLDGSENDLNDSHLQVKGRFLYDANGDKVIMRGIENVVRYGEYQGSGEWNDPYENGSLIDGNGDCVDELAKTGANATRLIGGRPEEFENALEKAVDNNLWVSVGHVDFRDKKVIETIQDNEAYVTLHAQGEVIHEDENKWREDSIQAIKEIRSLGYKAPIEITAGFYGQRFEMILNQGEAILNSDPLKNVVFVTQAYSEIENRGGVTANLDKLANFSAPVLVGASNFGIGTQNGYGNKPNTYKKVWDETYKRDLGSFYWAWSDAGYGDVVSSNRRFDGLTSVGDYIVNDSPANLSSHAPKTEFLLDAAVDANAA
ncbi:cellulose binding domain-containing protein [Myxosarcina sp. GI1]|uniref:cellulose binding domain-containing protein n=1 Tax=Myxosarcina sp. GI1 TaxID=1541065 RepID=UPI000568CB8C|nr:cellulose binding domain-containing protein [Myxosarcina sp. GI1]